MAVPGKIHHYIDRLEPYLMTDEGSYAEVRQALTVLALPYEIEPWRAYHTLMHLEDQANFLEDHITTINRPRIVFAASVGHDNVYQPWLYASGLRAPSVNEEQSRHLTRQLLEPHYPKGDLALIEAYIAATATHPKEVDDTDLGYFLDSDMRILGSDTERFEQYEQEIYREFSWLGTVARQQYLQGRLAFFAGVRKERIFRTEAAQDLYESQAHRNIGKMALRLSKELNR